MTLEGLKLIQVLASEGGLLELHLGVLGVAPDIAYEWQGVGQLAREDGRDKRPHFVLTTQACQILEQVEPLDKLRDDARKVVLLPPALSPQMAMPGEVLAHHNAQELFAGCGTNDVAADPDPQVDSLAPGCSELRSGNDQQLGLGEEGAEDGELCSFHTYKSESKEGTEDGEWCSFHTDKSESEEGAEDGELCSFHTYKSESEEGSEDGELCCFCTDK